MSGHADSADAWALAATRTYDEEKEALQRQGRKKAERLARLEEAIRADPRTGIGKPERLTGEGPLKGYWSRRIDKKNRLVYEVDVDRKLATLMTCLGHYDDR